MPPSWKPLRLNDDNVPQLLVKAKLDSPGYSILVTDLSHVWNENLTKRDIVRRAVKRDCTIDPSEGDDQYPILLKKIQRALDQEPDTRLDLRAGADKKDGLVLSLTAALPSPLPPFQWDVELRQLPPCGLEVELVRPLLLHAQRLQHQVQHLVHELADKDRVISKITDKLEQSGNDLTDVFPGMSNIKMSKKKPQREQLAKHVKGLGDFDDNLWRSQHDGLLDGGKLEIGTLAAVMRDVPNGHGSVEPATLDAEVEDWWRTIGSNGQANANGSAISQQSARLEKSPETKREDSAWRDSDDEFQRQATLPRLKPHSASLTSSPAQNGSQTAAHRPPTASTMEDEETEDEDDLDAGAPAPKTEKLSSIGDRLVSRPQAADVTIRGRSPIPSAPSPKKLGAIGGRSKSNAIAEPSAEAAGTKSRPKLGAIGSRGRTSTPPVDLLAEPESNTSQKSSPATKRKLGAIGVREATIDPSSSPKEPPRAIAAADATKSDPQLPERQSRALERQHEMSSPPRETSEDRANRKRDELKKRLEAEAKTPVKKKRKF